MSENNANNSNVNSNVRSTGRSISITKKRTKKDNTQYKEFIEILDKRYELQQDLNNYYKFDFNRLDLITAEINDSNIETLLENYKLIESFINYKNLNPSKDELMNASFELVLVHLIDKIIELINENITENINNFFNIKLIFDKLLFNKFYSTIITLLKNIKIQNRDSRLGFNIKIPINFVNILLYHLLFNKMDSKTFDSIKNIFVNSVYYYQLIIIRLDWELVLKLLFIIEKLDKLHDTKKKKYLENLLKNNKINDVDEFKKFVNSLADDNDYFKTEINLMNDLELSQLFDTEYKNRYFSIDILDTVLDINKNEDINDILKNLLRIKQILLNLLSVFKYFKTKSTDNAGSVGSGSLLSLAASRRSSARSNGYVEVRAPTPPPSPSNVDASIASNKQLSTQPLLFPENPLRVETQMRSLRVQPPMRSRAQPPMRSRADF